MANYDTWKATDTIGDEEAGRERAATRLEDDEREARWREFEAWAQAQHLPAVLRTLADLIAFPHHWPDTPTSQRLRDFADTEQWSGVLAALARALAAHQSSVLKD